MLFFRNFTYYIDKRRWKYIFLLATLFCITAVEECDATKVQQQYTSPVRNS